MTARYRRDSAPLVGEGRNAALLGGAFCDLALRTCRSSSLGLENCRTDGSETTQLRSEESVYATRSRHNDLGNRSCDHEYDRIRTANQEDMDDGRQGSVLFHVVAVCGRGKSLVLLRPG